MLGAACHLGAGVRRNPLEAYVWLLRRALGRSPLAAKYLDAARAALIAG